MSRMENAVAIERFGGGHKDIGGSLEARPQRLFSVTPGAPRRHDMRYSRFVILMKLMLPVVAVVLVGTVWAWPHIQGKDLSFRIGFSGLAATEAEDPSMVNPRYVGTDKDKQPYSLTADLAKNQPNDDSVIELEMPKGDIALKDGTWLVLTSESGLYQRQTKRLDLIGQVNLFHDTGYEIRTEKAEIDLDAGTAQGNDPVRGQGPFGDLKGEGFRLIERGERIFINGKAKVTMYPGLRKTMQ